VNISWAKQLVRIQEMGRIAREKGVPADANPYLAGYRGHGCSANGGNLQRQRAEYWRRGWESSDE